MEFLVLIPLFILGVGFGYVINYLSDVLPRTRHFTAPVCQKCGEHRSFADFFQLINCRSCDQPVSRRNIVVLVLCGLITAFLWAAPPHHLNLWLAFLCLIYLGTVAVIDLEHRVILNETSLAGVILGLVVGISIGGISKTLLGGAAGFLIMLGLYFLGEVFSRYMAKKRGLESDEVALGFGDVNLGGILGMMLGWPVILACLLFAILIGGLVSGGLILWMLIRRDYKPFTAIPYAPFLIASASVLLYLLK